MCPVRRSDGERQILRGNVFPFGLPVHEDLAGRSRRDVEVDDSLAVRAAFVAAHPHLDSLGRASATVTNFDIHQVFSPYVLDPFKQRLIVPQNDTFVKGKSQYFS